MSSDAGRLLEIQLDVHKRRLQEKGERINELEARNIDLEAQVSHLREVVDKQRTYPTNESGPAADLNKTQDRRARSVAEGRRGEVARSDGHPSSPNNLEPTQKKRSQSDRVSDGPSPESGGLESKRCRLSPEEVVQSRSSDSSHHAVKNSGVHGAAAPTVPKMMPLNLLSASHQSPKNLPRPPEPASDPVAPSVPSTSRGGIFGPSSRTYDLVSPYQPSHPVEDSDPESESSYETEYEDDAIPVQTVRSTSPKSTLEARIANVAPFDHGIVAEEYLLATTDRQTLGKRLNCIGSGTVVCSRDGTDFLFPNRRQHPYAPAQQGMPGLFFTAMLDAWSLSGAHEVFVGISPGKYKYMGEYTLEQMDALSPGEFKLLPRGTKSFWASNVLKQKKYGPIRRRILQNRTYGKNLDAKDIIRAYEKGVEKLYVWKMRCIEYDDELLCQATGLPREEGHCTGL